LRALWNLDGAQEPLDIQAAVGGSGELRLVALGAWGRTAFDVLLPPGAPPRLLRVSPPLRDDRVRELAGRDFDALFRAPPAAPLRFGSVGDAPPRPALCGDETGDGTAVRYLFDPRLGVARWASAERIRGGRCLHRIDVIETRRFEGCPQPLPSRLRIEAGTYTLDLQVLDVRLGAPPARAFRAGPDGM
jgi:hypothetical protein